MSALIMAGGTGVVLLLALSVFVAILLRRVVPTNMVHIVQSGRKTTSFGKDQPSGNVYYEIPSFIPALGVVVSRFQVSNFDVPLDNYAAYDAGRLPFIVDVRAFFHIFDSDMAAKRVSSFEELCRQLQEVLRGAVRRVLAEHRLEEILGMRTELGKVFTEQVDGQLAQWGVQTVKTIEFMDMRDAADSTVIHDIMAKDKARIQRESRVAVADNARQAQTAEIEAQREVELRQQEAAQTVGQRTALAQREVGIANEMANQEVLSQRAITAERDMAVKQVNDVKAAEIARQVAEVAAAQGRQVAITQAEGEAKQTEIVAQGQKAAALLNADAIRAEGEAQGRAKEAINLADVTPRSCLSLKSDRSLFVCSSFVRV